MMETEIAALARRFAEMRKQHSRFECKDQRKSREITRLLRSRESMKAKLAELRAERRRLIDLVASMREEDPKVTLEWWNNEN